MRFDSVGTVVTSSGLNVVDPIIVIRLRLRDGKLSGDVGGYTNLEEEAERGNPIQFRKHGTRNTITIVSVDISNVKANAIGESIEHIIERLAINYLQNKLEITVTRSEI